MTTQEREQQQRVEQVLAFLRKFKLTITDLTETGGQDLKSSDPKLKEKARRVEKCWPLMARLGVKHFDLPGDWQPGPASMPGLKRRRQGGGGGFLQPTDIAKEIPHPLMANSSMKSRGSDFEGPESNSAEKPPGCSNA